MTNLITPDSPLPDIIAHFREAIAWHRAVGGSVTVEVDILGRLLDAADRPSHPTDEEIATLIDRLRHNVDQAMRIAASADLSATEDEWLQLAETMGESASALSTLRDHIALVTREWDDRGQIIGMQQDRIWALEKQIASLTSPAGSDGKDRL